MRRLIVPIFLFLAVLAPWVAFNYTPQVRYITDALKDAASELAAVIAHNPRTVAGLKANYEIATRTGTPKVRVLVVAGHEPNYGGAEYGPLKERDMTVELADDLSQLLRNNGHYEVFETRTGQEWLPTFAQYFKDNWNDIIAWERLYKQESSRMTLIGGQEQPKVYHNSAATNVALRLYGITKWANENNVDITVHIHFNDYPGHTSKGPGKYSGFAIYVPAEQYLNSSTTRAVADAVFGRLKKYNPVSDMPLETSGVIDDPELIAVGANNTADSASMLIEYGYIYEPQFVNEDTRSLALKDLAFQTYLGLQDFFGSGNDYSLAYDTLILPYKWQKELSADTSPDRDIMALQTALATDGLYPPGSKTLNNCPRSGSFGPCTKEALVDFQKQNGIVGEEGEVGPKTLQALNNEYGTTRL